MATSIHPAFLNEDSKADEPTESNEEKLKRKIRSSIIGNDLTFRGPFGRKKALYCDWSSNGRSLEFIEEFYAKEVLPIMSTWSSISTVSSLQSTLYQDEAINIIRRACNASGDDKLIFAFDYNSSSSIYEVLIKSLQLFAPLVFVGITDDLNHSSWLKAGGEIVTVPETSQGTLDTDYLRGQLELHHNGDRPLVGCFSACSRLSGVLQDDVKITEILHQFGALSFWDYTSVAAYANIDMNPQASSMHDLYRKDALFFDSNLLVGGFCSPSILVVKAALFKHQDVCGDRSSKPPLGLTIRAGLALQLKERMSPDFIMRQQVKIAQIIYEKISKHPSVVMLGNKRFSSNTTLAFLVKNDQAGLYLHHKFVSTLLNDLFGIQSNVGNGIDSSYSMYIFGSDYDNISLDIDIEKESNSCFLKGFTIVDLAWFLSDAEINYALEAILLIAEEGWKLLPQYLLDLDSGEWSHYSATAFADRRSLSSIVYNDQGHFSFDHEPSCGSHVAFSLDENVLKAKEVFRSAKKAAVQTCHIIDMSHLINERDQAKRWFLLPSEARDILVKPKNSGPVCKDRLAIRIYNNSESSSGCYEGGGKVGTLTGRDFSHLELPNVTIQGKGYWLKKASKMKRNDEESETRETSTMEPEEEEEPKLTDEKRNIHLQIDDAKVGDEEEETIDTNGNDNAEMNANATTTAAKPYWIARFWTRRNRNKTQPLLLSDHGNKESRIEISTKLEEEHQHTTTNNNSEKLASIVEEVAGCETTEN